MTEDSVTYDSDAGQYHTRFALDEPDSVPDAIVFALAEIRDQDPIELPPLGDVVDPDAVGSVFRPADESYDHVSITFDYAGYVVTVNGTGTIALEERDRG